MSVIMHIESATDGCSVAVSDEGHLVFDKADREGHYPPRHVVLAALQPGPKIVFDITKVSRVFEIVPTVDDAKF